MDLAVESAIKVRHYQRGDFVRHLLPEYGMLDLDPKLTWVVEKDGMIVAVLITVYGSQMAVVIRLAATTDASPTSVLALLHYATRDMDEMGAKVLMAPLSVDRLPELKLAHIIQHAGGALEPLAGFIGILAIEKTRRKRCQP
jgi:hypothetical protein